MKINLSIFHNNNFTVHNHILSQVSKFLQFRKSILELLGIPALNRKIFINVGYRSKTIPPNLKNPILTAEKA
jgi:hypothetical protein